jgi:hypothetical protein
MPPTGRSGSAAARGRWEHLGRLGLLVDELVDPDDDLLAVVDGLGVGVGGLLDLVLHEALASMAATAPPMASIFSR